MSAQTRARFHLICLVAHLLIMASAVAAGWEIVAVANAFAALLHLTALQVSP
jgi:hypothetical protein